MQALLVDGGGVLACEFGFDGCDAPRDMIAASERVVSLDFPYGYGTLLTPGSRRDCNLWMRLTDVHSTSTAPHRTRQVQVPGQRRDETRDARANKTRHTCHERGRGKRLSRGAEYPGSVGIRASSSSTQARQSAQSAHGSHMRSSPSAGPLNAQSTLNGGTARPCRTRSAETMSARL